MSGTTAIRTTDLMYSGQPDSAPLCPSCVNGRLHPYKVTFAVMATTGAGYLSGWVAVCKGNRSYNQYVREQTGEDDDVEDTDGCGFTMQLYPSDPRMDVRL